jgi:hypothetical protein
MFYVIAMLFLLLKASNSFQITSSAISSLKRCKLQYNRYVTIKDSKLGLLGSTQMRLFSNTPHSSELSAEAPATSHGGLRNFVTNIIEDDLANKKNGRKVITRFPPEPNGYLHLGHAKSINFNFGVAKRYNGKTNMRFDDTNPAKEDMEYVISILRDVKWLVTGDADSENVPWDGEVRYASQYFPKIYEAAEYLIQQGLAYVDHLSSGNLSNMYFLSFTYIKDFTRYFSFR